MNRRWLAAVVALAAPWIAAPYAQTPKADWLTDGGDPQRTAWQRHETSLTKDNVKEMKLLWKIKLDNQPRQMHNLFPPLIAGSVRTPGGEKEIAVVAGVSDNIYAIDVANGTLLWKKKFDSTYQDAPGGRGGGVLCPGGLTATPVLEKTAPGTYVAYAVSWDGRLRKLDVATGEELEPPALFMPPNGKPYGLNLVNGVIYTSTAQGCGGNPDNFYSYDLATKKVGNWAPGSGGLWPRTGPSVGKDGTVYAGSGDGDYLPEQQIYGQAMIGVKQDPQTKALELKDWYAPSNAYWMFRGALATWEEANGTRWILSPFWGPKHPAFKAELEHGQVVYGGVAAFKLQDKLGKPVLTPIWISRDMYMADPPVIANGIVFAYGSGESTTQRWPEPGHVAGAEGRIQESTHAVLYALDALTGDELWSSGNQITSWNHFSGLSVANGRVYIGTFDGILYCFGAASLPPGPIATSQGGSR